MLPAHWHRTIFLFGIIGLAAGMLFGTVPTSIPQIIIAANWLLEKQFATKWQRIKTNPFFWILISVFVVHALGMLYTHNIQRGLDDLRNKAPLLILPILLFTTSSLTKKEFDLLMHFFYLSVVVSSVCCLMVYLGFTKKIIVDIRLASIFMSHIRYSLFIVFAILCMGYTIFTEVNKLKTIIFSGAIIWLLFILYKLEMATGFLCLIIVLNLVATYFVFKNYNKYVSLILCICGFLLVFYVGNKTVKSLAMFDKNPTLGYNINCKKTQQGLNYYHDTAYHFAENGYLMLANINENELKQCWNLNSKIHYDSLDARKNNIRFTIFRYMASKGFIKDSAGFARLTVNDIKHIEAGCTNYLYANTNGFTSRWYEIIWEYSKYKNGENPSGHSLTMRLEFWKTAIYIINHHKLIGVGTGDVQSAFNKAYCRTNSKLDKAWRLRSHNQYLAITVAFGFVGLILFILFLFSPAIMLCNKLSPLYWLFFALVLLSFITEDTLETQAGVSFFALYNTLFIWLASAKKQL